MNVDWEDPLKPGQRPCPVVFKQDVELPDEVIIPIDDELNQIFETKGYKLQTWGRSKDKKGKTVLQHDPHWIAVKNSTPLHVDPKYPRYSHHLKVRVDSGIVCRGIDKVEQPLYRGLFYILDSHSPHQVLSKEEGTRWNVGVSIDSHQQLLPFQIIPLMIKWASVKSVLERG
jgi:hypothetical protein